MLKFIATNVIVSRGYNDAPPVSFSKESNFVRFRIGARVYDKNAENGTRWVNISVKGFGEKFCEKIRKMELKEGSSINIIGRYDEDVWQDKETGERRSMPVIILDDAEYAGKRPEGSQKAAGDASAYAPSMDPASAPSADPAPAPTTGTMPGNFTGYEGFMGGGQFLDD